ncbi:unnamed protein product [Pedinophyceae sp. YPF-701]|nr:unnamed protein product [Pedinophyceae sp. YPF-701]
MAGEESPYMSHGGLRFVRPYHFEFFANVKKRWAGKKLIDLFADEFSVRPRAYYEEAVRVGRLRADGHAEGSDPVLKEGQRVFHALHRHEPPVLDQDVEVIEERDGVVAVCKPPCLPVHPCGQYNKNTVIGMLTALRPDLGTLLPVHRLDRPVSGLLLLAKNKQAASRLREQIEERSVRKVYVARVLGRFPGGGAELVADAALSWDAREGIAMCHAPGAVGTAPGSPTADDALDRRTVVREATTVCRLLRYDGPDDAAEGDMRGTSLVECRPLTGRTHQIRVHLKSLGHPIANDSLYGGTMGRKDLEDLRAARLAARDDAGAEPSAKRARVDGAGGVAAGEGGVLPRKGDDVRGELPAALTLPLEGRGGEGACEPVEWCPHCPGVPAMDYPLELEPLWLHARAYSGEGWAFEAPLPVWAEEGWSDAP